MNWIFLSYSTHMNNEANSQRTTLNETNNFVPTLRLNSGRLSQTINPTNRTSSSSYNRVSRSPSRAEVDKAILTLRSPSPPPSSSTLFASGTRSRLAYYKSSASPTNSDAIDSCRRSMSPPSRSPSRFSYDSNNAKVTSFSSKSAVCLEKDEGIKNGIIPRVYQTQNEVTELI